MAPQVFLLMVAHSFPTPTTRPSAFGMFRPERNCSFLRTAPPDPGCVGRLAKARGGTQNQRASFRKLSFVFIDLLLSFSRDHSHAHQGGNGGKNRTDNRKKFLGSARRMESGQRTTLVQDASRIPESVGIPPGFGLRQSSGDLG